MARWGPLTQNGLIKRFDDLDLGHCPCCGTITIDDHLLSKWLATDVHDIHVRRNQLGLPSARERRAIRDSELRPADFLTLALARVRFDPLDRVAAFDAFVSSARKIVEQMTARYDQQPAPAVNGNGASPALHGEQLRPTHNPDPGPEPEQAPA